MEEKVYFSDKGVTVTNSRFTAPGIDEPIDKGEALRTGLMLDYFPYVIGAVLLGMGLMVAKQFIPGMVLLFGGMGSVCVLKYSYFVDLWRTDGSVLRVYTTRDRELYKRLSEACHRVTAALNGIDIEPQTLSSGRMTGEEVVYVEAEGVRITSWKIMLGDKTLTVDNFEWMNTIFGTSVTKSASYDASFSPASPLIMPWFLVSFALILLGYELGVALMVGWVLLLRFGKNTYKIIISNGSMLPIEWTTPSRTLNKKVCRALEKFGITRIRS